MACVRLSMLWRCRRGQSAMEYLMTYGWAILVVMIVGITMWRLGLFNLGETPVSASGFGALQPLLPSCRVGVHPGGVGPPKGTIGGECLFVNNAGRRIMVQADGLNVSNQWGECYAKHAYDDPEREWPLQGNAQNFNNGCGTWGIIEISRTGTGPGDPFRLFWLSCPENNFRTSPSCPEGPPYGTSYAVGDPFEFEITIPYEITVGGTTVRKTVTGVIRGDVEEWSL